jgi:hypothetical protein
LSAGFARLATGHLRFLGFGCHCMLQFIYRHKP